MGTVTPPKITYSQTERLLNIKSTLGTTELLLEKFSGTEALSTPFEFKVALLSPEFSLDIKSLLRTSVTVTIFRKQRDAGVQRGLSKPVAGQGGRGDYQRA
jgi:uncharacterized protein involved in type VI secretion and phage assembly